MRWRCAGRKEAVAFLKKSAAKDFCSGLPGGFNGVDSGQKFFAALASPLLSEAKSESGRAIWFKKATASFF
jgi:hypothetical protein